MRSLLLLALLASAIGCSEGSSSASNGDVSAAAGAMDASKQGVKPQPDSDLSSSPPIGGGKK